MHRHPYYQKLGFKIGDFPEAESFHREAISIPIYPRLNKVSQDFVIKSILELSEYE